MSNQTKLKRLKAEMDATRKAAWVAADAAYAAWAAWDAAWDAAYAADAARDARKAALAAEGEK